MKLSDVMSAANLSFYAETGLLIFVGVFLAVCIRVLWPGQKNVFEELGALPLDEEVKPEALRVEVSRVR